MSILKPGESYYVTIDDDFVKHRINKAPLDGVKEGVWFFKTNPKTAKSEGGFNGQVRLTPEGTIYFDSLNKNDRKDFHLKLSQELTDAIPDRLVHITTNEKTEIDTSVFQKQIIISINIQQERSVSSAHFDLDTLIKFKSITVIGS
ncbi:8806_t:CDS:2, partial [Funneliformis mosseae]